MRILIGSVMACFHVALYILVSVVGFEITVFASSGIGSTLHVAGELFKMMAGVDIVHVPYRGGAPALVESDERSHATDV
jgi:hypothetical protein